MIVKLKEKSKKSILLQIIIGGKRQKESLTKFFNFKIHRMRAKMSESVANTLFTLIR